MDSVYRGMHFYDAKCRRKGSWKKHQKRRNIGKGKMPEKDGGVESKSALDLSSSSPPKMY